MPVIALVVVGATLSAWQARVNRDSPGAHWSVALVVLAIFVTAVALGRGSQRESVHEWTSTATAAMADRRNQPVRSVASVIVWSLLITGAVAWDLVSFIGQSHTLPTLSYYIGHVTRYSAGRGGAFAVWLAVGLLLAIGWRYAADRSL